ncbi:alpha/beta hydrolase [Bordetella genomosp. 8]|uniref:Alpha/beta hydrolase n=1 Tax=Bordetella genomosp. 8 TaxID=1416806 RepID=A0A1W6YK47_9BORD|nr:alpha/beta hydrolase [Bordetella genomosp. 8]ARP81364.1 alpha/beta hydrolase [Bordetella genomosp. 8]
MQIIRQQNGIELAWDSFGHVDAEAMLLISGLGTQMIRWSEPFCKGLAAKGYRVIRFDNRDAGCSTHLNALAPPDFGALAAEMMAGRRPGVPYTLYDMAADAIALLDALGIARAHVAGRSMGGMIAQVLASEHADRVVSLTSIMSSTGNPALPQAAADVMAMMVRPTPHPATDTEGFLAARMAFARRIAGTAYPFDETRHRAILLEEARRCHNPGGTARQIAAMAVAGDRRARLSTITAPTLVIHGTDDPLIPPACGHDTALAIPDAIYLPVEGMGHDIPPELEPMVIEAIHDRAVARHRSSVQLASGY